jgi:hypothetical protein
VAGLLVLDDFGDVGEVTCAAEIDRQLQYLGRVLRRMERLGFPLNDRLYQEVLGAYNAIHGLSVRLHYLQCGMGETQPIYPSLPAPPP